MWIIKPLIQVQGVKGLVLHGLDVDLPHVLEAEKDLLNGWPLLSLQLQGDIQLFKRRLECKRAIKLLNYIICDLDVLHGVPDCILLCLFIWVLCLDFLQQILDFGVFALLD